MQKYQNFVLHDQLFSQFSSYFFLFQFLCTLKTLYFALMRVRQAYKPLCSYMCANEREKKGEKKKRKEKRRPGYLSNKLVRCLNIYIYIFHVFFCLTISTSLHKSFSIQMATCHMQHASNTVCPRMLHATCVCIYHLDSNYPVYRL